ncbi:MAG TPA: class I SAM-dependent methyltransferase [Gaiellaceae bacterium]|nr:class I SAM-dependent methyltransferase [Gaiellaceae bacterium]
MQDLWTRAAAKARRTIYPRLPASVIKSSRIARLLARSAPMAVRGYRFGSDVDPVDATTSSAHVDGEPNALRSYVEAHHEGRGIYKGRHYFDIYVQHLARFVGREVVVVEVGVYSGGSVAMWKHYFGENATIHGIDIEEACRVYEGDGVHIHIGDQGDRAFWKRFKEEVPFIDVLIDDGGHHPNQMRVTFEELFPILRPGGVYICEDILGNPFLAYLGGLAEHLMTWTSTPLTEPGVASGFLLPQAGVASAADGLQQAVRSIHLYPFLAVVERTLEPVTDFQFPMYGTEWQPH